MKLLLISPPIQDFYDTDIRLQPIGLASIKAKIHEKLPLVEVKILDAHRGFGRKTIPVPDDLKSTKIFWNTPDKSPFSGFNHYYHFGASFEEIAAYCKTYQPDMIGLSSLFAPYYREVLKTAEAIKKVVNVPIIVGGSHASSCPELLLESRFVDFVIRGEGEEAMVDFLTVWQQPEKYPVVSGLAYKQNNTIILNDIRSIEPLDSLPVPDLSDFCLENYLFEGKPMCFVVTSRSCPHRCSFCSVHATFGLNYRRHSVDYVLKLLHKRYAEGYRVFDFEDDNLTYYKAEMKTLCERIIIEFKDKPIQLLAMNGISYLSLDDELLPLMKQAGFTHLNLALVTSDQSVLKTTKRPHTIEKYIQVVSQAVLLGFKITSYQILGLKQESLESMVQTLIFNAEQPVLLGASIFYMTPDSPIARDHGLERNDQNAFLARSTALNWSFNNWTREDIFTLFITTRIINFFKSLKAETIYKYSHGLLNHILPKIQAGLELLHVSCAKRQMHGLSTSGMYVIKPFKFDLFLSVMLRIPALKTTENELINIADFFNSHLLLETTEIAK